MAAGTWNTEIVRGTDWNQTLRITQDDLVYDLTGYSAEMVILNSELSPMIVLNTSNSRITIDVPTGELRLALTDAETLALTPMIASHYLNLTVGADTRRWLDGTVDIV